MKRYATCSQSCGPCFGNSLTCHKRRKLFRLEIHTVELMIHGLSRVTPLVSVLHWIEQLPVRLAVLSRWSPIVFCRNRRLQPFLHYIEHVEGAPDSREVAHLELHSSPPSKLSTFQALHLPSSPPSRLSTSPALDTRLQQTLVPVCAGVLNR